MSDEGTADRIASAARAILLAEGSGAVSMRRVAQDAGITPMAIYTYFPNRDALLRAIADAAFAELAAGWGARTAGQDWTARVFGLLDDFLDFALGAPHLYTFLMTDRREEARQFPGDFRDSGSPAYTPVVEVVAEGIRDGVLRQDDPLEVALALTAPIQGLVQLYHGGRIGLAEQEFRGLCHRTGRRVLRGLSA